MNVSAHLFLNTIPPQSRSVERSEELLATAYLSLGSNLGDRGANIRAALQRLAAQSGIQIVAVSSMYLTEPTDFTDQPDFVNAVVQIETTLSPQEVLEVAKGIERQMGRLETRKWGPRIIDVDILLFDDLIVDMPDLKIPHPRMMRRAFVIIPLAEIAPQLMLPDGRKPGEVVAELKHQRVCRLPEVS